MTAKPWVGAAVGTRLQPAIGKERLRLSQRRRHPGAMSTISASGSPRCASPPSTRWKSPARWSSTASPISPPGSNTAFTMSSPSPGDLPASATPPRGTGAAARPMAGQPFRPALHGLLYGLPAVCYPAAQACWPARTCCAPLIVGLLTSWSLSQGLAHLGYLRLGNADAGQAARLLLAGMAVGRRRSHRRLGGGRPRPAGSPAGSCLRNRPGSLHAGRHRTARAGRGADAAGQPGPRSARLRRVSPAPGGPPPCSTRTGPPWRSRRSWSPRWPWPGPGREAGRSGAGRRLVAGAELRAALPSAGFGLVAAGLLVFPVTAGLPGGHGANIGAVLASLPLALSMGVAEWLLIWFRRRTQRLLRDTRSLLAFTTRARLALFIALALYLLATAALISPPWPGSPARPGSSIRTGWCCRRPARTSRSAGRCSSRCCFRPSGTASYHCRVRRSAGLRGRVARSRGLWPGHRMHRAAHGHGRIRGPADGHGDPPRALSGRHSNTRSQVITEGAKP